MITDTTQNPIESMEKQNSDSEASESTKDCQANGDNEQPEESAGDEGSKVSESKREKEELKGKEAYDRGDYEEAVKCWMASLRSVKYLLDKKLYAHNAEHQKQVENMDLRFNLNLAQAHIKRRDFSKAIEFADNALKRDQSNTKALYRKSVALFETMNYPEAVQLLQKLLDLEPENLAAKDLLQKAKRNEAKGELRAKKMSQKIFGSRGKQADASTLSIVGRLRQICCRRKHE